MRIRVGYGERASPAVDFSPAKEASAMNQVNPFWAAVVTQFLGITLLVIIGILPFSWDQTDIKAGLSMIKYSIGAAFGVLIFGVIPAFISLCRKRDLRRFDIDWTILVFLVLDTLIILFLTWQQGGLTRSMFVPIFTVIPVAHLVIERSDSIRRVYWTVLGILICIGFSFAISWSIAARTDLPILSWIPVTDFSVLAPVDYQIASLIVNTASIVIIGAQVLMRHLAIPSIIPVSRVESGATQHLS